MGTANFKYMRSLPVWLEKHGVVLVHDDPVLASDEPDAWRHSQGYILRQEQAELAFERAAVFRERPHIVLIGHTHVPAVFTTAGEIAIRCGEPVLLPQNCSCILNPGAVGGRGRSALGNSCAILDTENNTFTVLQLPLPKLDDPWEDFFDKVVSY
jgi:predicted phosphodiesterase